MTATPAVRIGVIGAGALGYHHIRILRDVADVYAQANAAIGGAIWMLLFYSATAIWPTNNPFVDEHVVYFVVLIGIAIVGAGRYLGLGRYWERFEVVKKHPILT